MYLIITMNLPLSYYLKSVSHQTLTMLLFVFFLTYDWLKHIHAFLFILKYITLLVRFYPISLSWIILLTNDRWHLERMKCLNTWNQTLPWTMCDVTCNLLGWCLEECEQFDIIPLFMSTLWVCEPCLNTLWALTFSLNKLDEFATFLYPLLLILMIYGFLYSQLRPKV